MDELVQAVQFYPAIDNHTHPLLAGTHKDDFAFEGLLSEAQGAALTEDAVHTLACYRATRQLSEILECENDWSTVKERRSSLDYQQLCKLCMEKTGIQCFLLDDGLDSEEICEDIRWHDKFTASPSKRIVRVEVVAQVRRNLTATEYAHRRLSTIGYLERPHPRIPTYHNQLRMFSALCLLLGF